MSRDVPHDEPHNKRATSVDKHVGQRLREQRLARGLSLQQLASIIGMNYQQAHKYERGLNRISAGRLFIIARALATDPAWFFEGISGQDEAKELSSRERLQLELMQNFAAIKDEKQLEAISSMARSLAGS
ncbi:helix-turn-helix domain-containing protein [Belnapia rosea]|uniref:Transcriptional regulator, contains XRE-family HTH domain n=1 Tax=Belnapia rosea TaxID=938405 RepID=A0A1G7DH89_9PROT|nr:helix-turn-helix transcriptional regulator [Belnapia rosea]SDE50400.1 Transcriptional regulator, contains XRE-family HTH domain [Belnapia rosea]